MKLTPPLSAARRLTFALVFSLALLEAGILHAATSLTRGPYLQLATSNSMTLRWRTSAASDSRVRYGVDAANLNQTATAAASVTEHVVQLNGLTPDTRYYYAIGSSVGDLAGGADYFFYTAPTAGTRQALRFWILGDPGTGNANQFNVRDAYYAFTGARYTDLMLMLGDNAYNSGTDTEFQNNLFNVYPTVLRKTPLFPTIGNHDTAQSTNPNINTTPYFLIFSLPTGAEAGGVASGTEKYYSFNYGNVHFVCLDSMTSDRAATGPMLTWLQYDLAANTADWLIAFWHHPPYSKGSHNSDTETELIQMRQNALPILENYGVDLVLSGHSHSYERSFLLNGHYGSSSTLTAAMKLDAGSGRDGTAAGAYQKPNTGPNSHEGAVYVVAGSSGQTSGGTLNHSAMFISLNQLGSVVLDIDTHRLDAKFITDTGAINDYFTLLKGPVVNNPPSVAITSPTSGASFTAPAAITLTATALDSDGTVASVAFYQGSTLLGTDTTAPFSVNWSGVPAGSYTLVAVATDNLGAQAQSAPVLVTVNSPAAPAAPSGLTATAVSSTQINLAWTDNATDETGFALERSTDNVTFTQITLLAANATSYANTGLSAGTTYYYRVRAYSSTTWSAYSGTASASTPGLPPAAPTGLTATAASSSQINLAWTDNANNETGFAIERSADGVTFAQITTVGANVTAYANAGLSASTTYLYRVRASNSSGYSAYSSVAQATTPATSANTKLIAAGSVWKYRDDGSDQGTAWRGVTFADTTWASGPAQLGYGDGDEATVVGYGPNASSKFITTYFRQGFSVADPGAVSSLLLRALRDDGAVVYLNGTEIYRGNMPAGTVNYLTLAPTAIGGADETTWWETNVPLSLLVAGLNVVAVEIHQANGTSSDISFDLELIASGSSGVTPPAAPSGLTAAAASSSQINLAWTDNANNETGFAIERSTDNVTFTPVASVGANVTTYANTGLSASTTYYYRVRASNSAGNSAYSATASATTAAILTPPAAPSGLTATAASSSQINLAWTDNANNETGFAIERSTDNVTFTPVASVGANVTTYANTGLSASTTYYYRVRASNSAGNSAYSATASATTVAILTPPAAPSGLTATAASSSQINLAWTDNANNEAGFAIERSTDNVTFTSIASVGANVTAYASTGLSASTTYYYRVRASNSAGNSAYSGTASATTQTPVATTVTLTSVASQDGYVRESSEYSEIGGAVSSASTGTDALRAGDDASDRQYKTILSFDTASLPDGATILSAKLRLKRGLLVGTSPFRTHIPCRVDIKGGNGFNNSLALTVEDFRAPADGAGVAVLGESPTNGSWGEAVLDARGLSFVNKAGTTQFRVYFQRGDNDDNGADYMGWYSGDIATSSDRPQLEIIYQ